MPQREHMNKRRQPVDPFIVFGLLFLLAALLLVCYNLMQDYSAFVKAEQAARQVEQSIDQSQSDRWADAARAGEDAAAVPEYVLHPELPMPEIEADGIKYIGMLEIDALSLQLPVISQWSYAALKTAPARYAGSVYQDNMVIAAHNYSRHFGNLKELQQGDTVSFTDMDGNSFFYQVAETDILSPTEIDEMVSGSWALTLFTCTVGGASRVTVRCNKL